MSPRFSHLKAPGFAGEGYLLLLLLIRLIADNGSCPRSDSATDEGAAAGMTGRAADKGSGTCAYSSANERSFLRLRRTAREHRYHNS